jgi:hypothetical protein
MRRGDVVSTYVESGDILCIRGVGDVARTCECGEFVEID